MNSYNPYRDSFSNGFARLPDNLVHQTNVARDNTIFRNKSLIKLSMFGRNYNEYAYKNARLIHPLEDPQAVDDFSYRGIQSKLNALASDGTNVASLNIDQAYKLQLFQRYAKEPEINYYVAKMANEIINYTKDKYFCEIAGLSEETYSKEVIERTKEIFLKMYDLHGFNIQSRAYDKCFDFLTEGYVAYEMVYDNKRKNIVSFQRVDPVTLYPVIDDETGIKLWIQNINNVNPRIILDSDLIYIAYSGASKYSDMSYIEPMIRPYNELKGLERTRIIFNIINSTMHKTFSVPMGDIPKHLQEQELVSLISLYKDSLEFDNYEGITYINGSKDHPYSKEEWFIDSGNGGVKVENQQYGSTDLNEDITLNWFRNNFKQSTKFPLTKLDQSSGGGGVYNFGSDITYDDYAFEQFVSMKRNQFQEILIKPIYTQLIMEFPELIDSNILNDLSLHFYSNDEIMLARRLNNLQVKMSIAADLTSNFKDIDGEKPYLHPRLVAEKIIELPKELLKLNEIYWKKESDAQANEGGGDFGGDDIGGGDDDLVTDDIDTGGDDIE